MLFQGQDVRSDFQTGHGKWQSPAVLPAYLFCWTKQRSDPKILSQVQLYTHSFHMNPHDSMMSNLCIHIILHCFLRIEELKTEHNWVPEDSSFGFNRWAFVEDLLAPGVAMKYDGLTHGLTNGLAMPVWKILPSIVYISTCFDRKGTKRTHENLMCFACLRSIFTQGTGYEKPMLVPEQRLVFQYKYFDCALTSLSPPFTTFIWERRLEAISQHASGVYIPHSQH